MANPFQDKQDTTGGKAAFAAFNELTSDKAYDDETLKENPGSPLPFPVENPPEQYVDAVKKIERPDYEGIQLQKFKDIKKTCEAMDDIFEREYIDKINSKKGKAEVRMNFYNDGDNEGDWLEERVPQTWDNMAEKQLENKELQNQINSCFQITLHLKFCILFYQTEY